MDFDDYIEYFDSVKWKAKVNLFLYSNIRTSTHCYGCGRERTKDMEVIHRTHIRFKQEHLWDLLLICNRCHKLATYLFDLKYSNSPTGMWDAFEQLHNDGIARVEKEIKTLPDTNTTLEINVYKVKRTGKWNPTINKLEWINKPWLLQSFTNMDDFFVWINSTEEEKIFIVSNEESVAEYIKAIEYENVKKSVTIDQF